MTRGVLGYSKTWSEITEVHGLSGVKGAEPSDVPIGVYRHYSFWACACWRLSGLGPPLCTPSLLEKAVAQSHKHNRKDLPTLCSRAYCEGPWLSTKLYRVQYIWHKKIPYVQIMTIFLKSIQCKRKQKIKWNYNFVNTYKLLVLKFKKVIRSFKILFFLITLILFYNRRLRVPWYQVGKKLKMKNK